MLCRMPAESAPRGLHARYSFRPDDGGVGCSRGQVQPVSRREFDRLSCVVQGELDAAAGAVKDLVIGVRVRAVTVDWPVRPPSWRQPFVAEDRLERFPGGLLQAGPASEGC